MFNSIDICSFIPVSACHGVGMGPGALFFQGPSNTVKTALDGLIIRFVNSIQYENSTCPSMIRYLKIIVGFRI
jgi:hypothetical protein